MENPSYSPWNFFSKELINNWYCNKYFFLKGGFTTCNSFKKHLLINALNDF